MAERFRITGTSKSRDAPELIITSKDTEKQWLIFPLFSLDFFGFN